MIRVSGVLVEPEPFYEGDRALPNECFECGFVPAWVLTQWPLPQYSDAVYKVKACTEHVNSVLFHVLHYRPPVDDPAEDGL